MMISVRNKKLISTLLTTMIMVSALPVGAESLFRAGVAQSVSPVTPRSWYTGIRANNIGDVVTIIIEDKSSITNSVDLSSNKKDATEDNWSSILDKILPGKGVVPNVDGWGGATKVTNSASLKRQDEIKQSVAAQVVQVLPNGNLVVQAKKSLINCGERQDIVLSGIVNPRMIDGSGSINSQYVANLQLAIVGKGTVSRAQSDGVMNKLLRFLF